MQSSASHGLGLSAGAGGKRHTTPPRPTSRPRQAPGLLYLGPGGLDLCPPVRVGRRAASRKAAAHRPPYESGPVHGRNLKVRALTGPAPLILCLLPGPAGGAGPLLGEWRAHSLAAPRLPVERLDKAETMPIWGPRAPSPHTNADRIPASVRLRSASFTFSFPVPAALWHPVYRTAHRARS